MAHTFHDRNLMAAIKAVQAQGLKIDRIKITAAGFTIIHDNRDAGKTHNADLSVRNTALGAP